MCKNMKLVVILFACFVRAESSEVCEADWDYRGKKMNGPTDWSKTHPSCSRSLQSPINIDLKQLSPPNRDNVIWFDNYYTHPAAGETYTLSNNGHTLIFKLPENTCYYLKKGPDTFVPMQAHIHFGSLDIKGSEHSINGRYSQAEVRLLLSYRDLNLSYLLLFPSIAFRYILSIEIQSTILLTSCYTVTVCWSWARLLI
ncbi:carbonic anhydrase 6-like [Hydractinia symbiolongicarpus]|uniref:carbonic anhydrase 6-like n=1 Tax=Hydractinia symbiolongicarpus TaxID=13093 RepID=UPI00254FBB56|nr:carbonic anhydrase 6-like [Hydractinia symbiolongicarpus]